MKTDITLWIAARAIKSVSIEERHTRAMARLSRIGTPLGFSGLDLPIAPDCGEHLGAAYGIKFPIRGLRFVGNYVYRGERYIYRDIAVFDDNLRYGFKTSNKALDYKVILHEHFPNVINAFEGYRAFASYAGYSSAYCGGYVPSDDGVTSIDSSGHIVQNNPIYNRLIADEAVDVDGRNNIYSLEPAMYWDAELCQRALGYGRDEVIRRLNGLVPKIVPLLDGVYVVFSDNPQLSFEEFMHINTHFKVILGLE